MMNWKLLYTIYDILSVNSRPLTKHLTQALHFDRMPKQISSEGVENV